MYKTISSSCLVLYTSFDHWHGYWWRGKDKITNFGLFLLYVIWPLGGQEPKYHDTWKVLSKVGDESINFLVTVPYFSTKMVSYRHVLPYLHAMWILEADHSQELIHASLHLPTVYRTPETIGAGFSSMPSAVILNNLHSLGFYTCTFSVFLPLFVMFLQVDTHLVHYPPVRPLGGVYIGIRVLFSCTQLRVVLQRPAQTLFWQRRCGACKNKLLQSICRCGLGIFRAVLSQITTEMTVSNTGTHYSLLPWQS